MFLEPVSIQTPHNWTVNHLSPPEAKIALFRTLFRGRDDVYPRRFESRKTGKAGYQPACANEWVRGVCEKPRIKCSDCPRQRFLPVTDDAIRWHLSGQDDEGKDFFMGIYPMLADRICWFLAADFEEGDWRRDASAFTETSLHHGVPVAVERSQSGNGARYSPEGKHRSRGVSDMASLKLLLSCLAIFRRRSSIEKIHCPARYPS
jgi:hypothetical protein